MGCTAHLGEGIEGVTRDSCKSTEVSIEDILKTDIKSTEDVEQISDELKYVMMVGRIKAKIEQFESDRGDLQAEIENLKEQVYAYNNTIFTLQSVLKQGQ